MLSVIRFSKAGWLTKLELDQMYFKAVYKN